MNLIYDLIDLLELKGANDTVCLDMRKTSSLLDVMIVTSANNNRLQLALVDYVTDYLDKNNIPYYPFEKNESSWMLVDAYDVVIHIFTNESREFYGLDKLWKHCIVEKFNDE